MLVVSLLALLVVLCVLIRQTGFSLLNALLGRLYGRAIRIKSVGWKRLEGIEVTLPNGWILHVNTLRFTLFPTNFSKPLLISLHDVRVEGATIEKEQTDDAAPDTQPSAPSSTASTANKLQRLQSLAQYVAISIDGAHVIYLDSSAAAMLHATLDDVRLEAFRGPKQWQAECSIRLLQGKALHRSPVGSLPSAPSPPLAEFSLAASLSLDSSLNAVNLALQEPVVSISHRALELCSALELPRRKEKRKEEGGEERTENGLLNNLNVSLSSFAFRYAAEIEGSSRGLSLTTGATQLTRKGDECTLQLVDAAIAETGRKTALRSAAITVDVKLPQSSTVSSPGTPVQQQQQTRSLEARVATAGATVVCSVPDLLQWQSHAVGLLQLRKKRSRKEEKIPSTPSSSPASPSSSLSLLVDVSHLECTLIGLDGREWMAVAKLINISKSEMATEVAFDEVWVTRAGRVPTRGVHEWGEVLSIGTAIVELSTPPTGPPTLLVAADDAKIEWSEDILQQLQQLQKRMQGMGRGKRKEGGEKRGVLAVEATLRRATIVATAREASMACVVVLEMTIRGDGEEWNVLAKETRMVTGSRTSSGIRLDDVLTSTKMQMSDWTELRTQYRTWKQKELEEKWREIRVIHFERRRLSLNAAIPSVKIVVKKGQQASIEIDSSAYLSWSPLLHTIGLHVLRTTKGLTSSLSRSSSAEDKSPSSPLRVAIAADGGVQIDLELADYHVMSWLAPVVQVEVTTQREITVLAPSLQVEFDGVRWLTVTDVCLARRLQDDKMDSLRAATKGLDGTQGLYTKSNKVWSWTAERVHFFLPFAFNWAAAFDEFTTVIKWVKIMSGKRAGRPADPQLAADLHVFIQEAILEMEDDPFERQLQSNHELKEDEVFECERRRQMLADSIAKHVKSAPLFSQAKIDELYRSLLEKNSELYIKRHAQLGENDTTLVCSTWTKLELRALADESMRRDEQCLALIAAIDTAAPPPSPSIEWITMWGRSVHISMEEWHVRLRDYPLPYCIAQNLHLFGTVVAAERLSAAGRSLREQQVPLPAPWTTLTVNRNISPLKLFYDLQAESESMTLNYGPCWEPALAMVSLQWNNISKPSRDPSPLLPFWDKMRFLMHGRLTWSSATFVTNMLASLDPYNTSETLVWEWKDWLLDWAQGEICSTSALDVSLRTASRYDDSRLLCLPSVNLKVAMTWNCLGQPYDHHAVELCTADKLPHLSTDHDSYRAFRSLSVNVNLTLSVNEVGENRPSIMMYANCIRCLDLLMKTISRTNGNTRRGTVFGVPPISKRQLSKHFRNVHVSIKLPKFEITYLTSQSSPQGLRLTCDQVDLYSSLVQSAQPPINDQQLKRRPQFRWTVEHISATLGATQVHVLGVDPSPATDSSAPESARPLLSFARVVHTSEKGAGAGAAQKRVTVFELRLAWTAAQRDVCLGIAEGTRRAALLRSMLGQHLSAIVEAATEERKHYEQRRRKDVRDSARERDRWEDDVDETTGEQPADLLERLIEEADTKKVAHCEHSAELPSDSLQGISQATSDDVTAISWHIELVNSQMMLSGDAGKFVLVAASKATLSQKVHRSVWRSAQLLSKKSWSAMLNGMQYFAPISRSAWEDEERSWLTKEEIEDRSGGEAHNGDRVNALMGAGEAVGGMVKTANGRQLQRIISRCSCQIYWVSFSEKLDDEEEKALEESTEENEEMEEELAVDCITLKHNMLEASTNSEQYSLAVDVVNQLVLFVDPRMKENAEKRNRRLFECRQLSMEDMISSIETQQKKLREVVCLVRTLERHLHMDTVQAEEDAERRSQLLREMEEYKTKQLDLAELMAITISVLKQRQVQKNRVVSLRQQEGEVPLVRKFEVCFEDCTWKLTEHDGMIGIAQLHITNFLYARTMRVDNGGEHLFELGTMRVKNLLTNTPFPDTLDRDSRHPRTTSAVRVRCKDLAPVGGIAVKEHFEVNIAPMVVQFTFKFFDAMMTFFFPERNEGHAHVREANLDVDEGDKEKAPQRRLSLSRRITGGLSMVRSSSGRAASSVTPIAVDDIDKMRQRANSNNLFLYIKIPEVPILVSYKGNKEKNIEDVRNLPLNFPLCEWHERNWTWLDLSIAIKQRSKKELIQQYMKQKLLRRVKGDDKTPISDEEKKRIAVGRGMTPAIVDKQKK